VNDPMKRAGFGQPCRLSDYQDKQKKERKAVEISIKPHLNVHLRGSIVPIIKYCRQALKGKEGGGAVGKVQPATRQKGCATGQCKYCTQGTGGTKERQTTTRRGKKRENGTGRLRGDRFDIGQRANHKGER